MGTRKDKLWSKHLNEVGLTFIDEKMGKSLNLVFSCAMKIDKCTKRKSDLIQLEGEGKEERGGVIKNMIFNVVD
jgi:hypothetical protein